jgi:hypothetical protein
VIVPYVQIFDSIILKYIVSIKMMEAIHDQLESCRYDNSVRYTTDAILKWKMYDPIR